MVQGKNSIDKDKLYEYGDSMKIQKHQLDKVVNQNYKNKEKLDTIKKNNEETRIELEKNFEEAETLLRLFENGEIYFELENSDYNEFMSIEATEIEQKVIIPEDELIQAVEWGEEQNWSEYMALIKNYAKEQHIDLLKDPFEELLTPQQIKEIENRVREDYSLKGVVDCDKYDYLIASFSGAISGIIDSLFVGMPGESKIGNWSYDETDKFVKKIAKLLGWSPKGSNSTENQTMSSAIRFLENKFKVNYDQQYGGAAGDLLNMSASNHHLKSLGHSPDLIGMVFSIIDQFTSTSHFLDNGRLITFDTKKNTLYGSNFISKLFCGFANWLGHLISDVAGSSGSRSKGGVGAGIPMPLFELFQLIGVGSIKHKDENYTIADFSVKVFEQSNNGQRYDMRFGIAQAVPVLINELFIRLMWSIKRYFYHDKSFIDSLPFGNKPSLRRMLLVGHGSMCLVDFGDAAIRSGASNPMSFVLHLNFIGWSKFAFAGMKEIRSIYFSNAIDNEALDNDLEKEWERLYKSV
ncbi:hypothetical protein [Carnobacterium sp. TMP28]|uniref:hypothetical protein n=1 Tax=Carnobacterium sp. TMP28 TaxID=3397060 RepID=UPI0039DF71F5